MTQLTHHNLFTFDIQKCRLQKKKNLNNNSRAGVKPQCLLKEEGNTDHAYNRGSIVHSEEKDLREENEIHFHFANNFILCGAKFEINEKTLAVNIFTLGRSLLVWAAPGNCTVEPSPWMQVSLAAAERDPSRKQSLAHQI